MPQRLLISLLFMLGSSSVVAQTTFTLSGVVRDSATGQPIARAAIVLDYQKVTRGTYTNAQGHFTIAAPSGQYVVVVRSLGYVPFRTTLYLRENRTLTVNLPSVSSQLEEVIVTSKGDNLNVRQPLLGVSQISIATLKKMPAALGDFPPNAANRLDLYKGNVPARYGGRAASMPDISLRNPDLNQFSLTGGVSLVANRLTVETPLIKGKLSLMVSARGAFNDFLLRAVSPRFDNIRAKFGDGTAKLFWWINDKNTVTAMGYLSQDLFQTNLLGSLANVNAVNTQYAQQTVNSMVRWFHAFNDQVNVQTTALVAQYIPRILSTEDSTNNKVDLKQSLRQRQIKSNLNYKPKAVSGLSGSITKATVEVLVVSVQVIGAHETTDGTYQLPSDFKGQTGHRYQLRFVLSDGTTYTSTPQIMPAVPPVTAVRAQFNPTSLAANQLNGYSAGHDVYMDAQDPADQRNYYRWDWNDYEKQDWCRTCKKGVYAVNNVLPGVYQDNIYFVSGDSLYEDCFTPAPTPTEYGKPFVPDTDLYYDYNCRTQRWEILHSYTLNVFDDQYSNGRQIANRLVAHIPFYTRQPCLIEIRQSSLTPIAILNCFRSRLKIITAWPMLPQRLWWAMCEMRQTSVNQLWGISRHQACPLFLTGLTARIPVVNLTELLDGLWKKIKSCIMRLTCAYPMESLLLHLQGLGLYLRS